MDRQSVHEELERVRVDFRQLVESADDDVLRKPPNGTRWNNRQLLFHMLMRCLIIRTLLRLVRVFGRLPIGASRIYALAERADPAVRRGGLPRFVHRRQRGRPSSDGRDVRPRDVGRRLLHELIASTEAADIWTIQSGIFPENTTRLALHTTAGFRTIDTWRNVIAIERRNSVTGT